MPQNFPDIWVKRVIQNLDESDKATFLDGIAELEVDVHAIHAGDVSEKNIIFVPSTEFDVEVLINFFGELAIQEYDDDHIQINLDCYRSKPTSVPDDKTIGCAYDIIDTVTKSHTRGMKVKKYQKSIHNLAPQSHTLLTPVIKATGIMEIGTDPVLDGGRPILTYNDLVTFKEKMDGYDIRLVLSKTHWSDLLRDRKRFANILVDYKKGSPAPEILDMEIHKYDSMPIYTAASVKKPFGSIVEAGDLVASVAFSTENVAKKSGLTRQYFLPAKMATRTNASELSYRHYFVAIPFKQLKIGAIL